MQSTTYIERYQQFGSHIQFVDLLPIKFWPKGTDPHKDARFTFHMWRAVLSAIADPLVTVVLTLRDYLFV